MPRWARFLRWALLMVPASLAILATLELLLRLLGVGPEIAAEVRPIYEKFQPDAELIWSLKGSWRGRELNGAPVSTGERGFRGPELRADARTLLFLGDSVVFGHYLGDEDTLPAQLQALLETRLGGDLQVVNAGVPGFSTFQEVALYRTRGRPLRPDAVLLGFCLNDVTERYVSVVEYGGPRFFMMNVDTSRSPGPLREVWLSSAIRSVFTRAARAYGKRSEIYDVTSLWQRSDTPEIQEAWGVVLDELEQLIASVRDDGIPLGVVVFPYRMQLNETRSAPPQRLLADFLDRRGVAHLDLLPLMESERDPERFFLDANHLSEAGSRRTAEWIAAFVLESGLLPSDPAP